MRLPRLLIVILALMVSPVAAAVCEVACGVPPVVTADNSAVASGADEHAHHGHHAPPQVAAADPSAASLTAPDCDLTPTSPARLRTSFADSTGSVAAITSRTVLSADSRYVSPLSVAAAPSPPASPPHAPVPLRI